MTDINKTIKKLLFLSTEICEIYDSLAKLSVRDLEKSDEFDKLIEFLDNYLTQETILLDSLEKKELISIIRNLYAINQTDAAMYRCYASVKDYFIAKYPTDEYIAQSTQYTNEEYNATNFNGDIFEDDDDELIDEDDDYEDDTNVREYANYAILRTAITAIKKMGGQIKDTETNNKVDYKYKKDLLKYFKGFKYNFFNLNRDAEMLGIKYRFNIDGIPEMPRLNVDVSSICFNDCIDILDSMYNLRDSERNIDVILQALFDMLCFDEYIKELSPYQIDKLINICYNMEDNYHKGYFGNIGLQKLVKIKKN